MTCIVGLVDEGIVYIGGDSAGVAGWDLIARADQKVFCNNGLIMGFTWSFRMGQLLQYAFVPPPLTEGQDIYAYMVTSFIDGVRDCLKKGGYASRENEREEGGQFLVGYKGRLFSIGADYQVGESKHGYHAVGSGAQVALGALFATKGTLPPVQRVLLALEAAEEFTASVRRPFVTESA